MLTCTLNECAGGCRYSNGDVYKGAFVDGKKHGHGVLKQGKFSASLANVYVGHWQADKRHGYGVCDDIPKGAYDVYLHIFDIMCFRIDLVTWSAGPPNCGIALMGCGV